MSHQNHDLYMAGLLLRFLRLYFYMIFFDNIWDIFELIHIMINILEENDTLTPLKCPIYILRFPCNEFTLSSV